ncbi:lytic murein transglycosylase [Phyllobacterium myrsinacearum]|uniref:Lytic murein transglycosylase n=1 Tax=Phyllobacterium myrsinacearum TaxID=28101 RepID=A0A2S9JBL7_9HYPH|nr:lytic murein transglycosylase [Phyllobacterium myrsinacearum]
MPDLFTPLCPAGHLPHKGGDRASFLFRSILRQCSVSKSVDADVISPLVGEMGGSPEGGV